MSTTPSPMVQMYAPDGTFGEVPYEHMHDALQAGGKMAVHMKAPDGTDGYVPADRVQDAQKAGGAIVPFEQPAPAQQPGFMASVGNTLKSMIPTSIDPKQLAVSAAENLALPGLPSTLGAIKEGIAAHERGHGVPYSTLAATASGVGVNPERMEAAANQGNTSGVLSEAAVPASIAALGGGAKAISDALPNAARAGAGFKSISSAIGEHPVGITDELSQSLNALRKASATTNTNIPPVVRKLIDRLDPFQGGGPLTYDDARAFSSEIGQLSASDKMSMTANTHRLVSDLYSSLKSAVQDTADVAGKGEQLRDAMTEYRRAMSLKGWSEEAQKQFLKYAVGGAVGYAGWKAAKDIVEPFLK